MKNRRLFRKIFALTALLALFVGPTNNHNAATTQLRFNDRNFENNPFENDSPKHAHSRAVAATQSDTKVTVTDIGPELGASYSAAGFVINGNDPTQIILPSEGGIFKSLNGGQSWSRVELLNGAGFLEGSIFVRQDPNNASVLFTVTLATTRSSPSVYRSDDFGETWTPVEADLVAPFDCAIDQASSNVVFVLSQFASDELEQPTALFKSTDGGITFVPQIGSGLPEKIFEIFDSEVNLLADPRFTNIATTPADPNIVYVAHFGDPLRYYAPGIYKSVDGGESFMRLENSPPRPLQIFPHPTNPNVVFVQDQFDVESPGIYRSQDGGATFEPVTEGLPSDKWNFFVEFDRHNPSFVYIAGEGGFFRSTDGGTSFQPLGLKPDQVGLGATTATVDPANPSVIYVNTNRGNFKSFNGGVSFVAINNGWKTAFANHIAFDNASEPNLYLALPFGNGILKTGSRGNYYEQLRDPVDPGGLTSGERWPRFVAIAQTDPNFIACLTRASGIYTTLDGGQSWHPANTDTGQTRFSSLAIDPVNPNNVYVTSAFFGFPGFYRSSDGGQNFQSTYFGPTQLRSLFLDLEIDSLNPDVIYTGAFPFLTNNVLLRSIDGGLTFSGTQLGFASSITDIEVDPTNPNNLYVAGLFNLSNQGFVRNRLVRSTDGGATFIPADSGIPAFTDVIGIVIDPQTPSRLFAWTLEGLFMSTDSATTWTLLEGDKTRQHAALAAARTIAINPKKPDRLYLAGATVLEVEIKE